MHLIRAELYCWIEAIFRNIPGKSGVLLRRFIYKFYFSSVGKNFNIGISCRIQQPQAITLGNNVGINDKAWIAANLNGGKIIIGDNTIIGPNCLIHTGNHKYKDRGRPINNQGYIFKDISIGSDVWIGANVTILQGVTIKNGAIVGAGAVLTSDVQDFTIVAGVPAKKIGER